MASTTFWNATVADNSFSYNNYTLYGMPTFSSRETTRGLYKSLVHIKMSTL